MAIAAVSWRALVVARCSASQREFPNGGLALHLWHHLLSWPVPWGRSGGIMRPEGCLDDNSNSKGWEKQLISSHWDAVPPQAWRTKVVPWVGGSTRCQCVANAGCSALERWQAAAVTVCYLTSTHVGARWRAVLGLGRSTGWIPVRASWEAAMSCSREHSPLYKAVLLPSEINRCLGMASCATKKVSVACKWR